MISWGERERGKESRRRETRRRDSQVGEAELHGLVGIVVGEHVGLDLDENGSVGLVEGLCEAKERDQTTR